MLAACVADLRGWVSPDDLSYASLHLVGAGVLSMIAVLTGQWGFVAYSTPSLGPRPKTPRGHGCSATTSCRSRSSYRGLRP